MKRPSRQLCPVLLSFPCEGPCHVQPDGWHCPGGWSIQHLLCITGAHRNLRTAISCESLVFTRLLCRQRLQLLRRQPRQSRRHACDSQQIGSRLGISQIWLRKEAPQPGFPEKRLHQLANLARRKRPPSLPQRPLLCKKNCQARRLGPTWQLVFVFSPRFAFALAQAERRSPDNFPPYFHTDTTQHYLFNNINFH